MAHDFGTVNPGEKPVYEFKFKNNFDRPIRVYSLSTDARLGKEIEHLDRQPQRQMEWSRLHSTAQAATMEWIEPGRESTIQIRLEPRGGFINGGVLAGPVTGEFRVTFAVKGLDQVRTTTGADGNAFGQPGLAPGGAAGRGAGGSRRGAAGANPLRTPPVGMSTVVLTVTATDGAVKP